jgi:hypothetical protein
MEFVQKGMKSSGFRGPLPNPHQEQKVINLHRNLAEFMQRGAARDFRIDPYDPHPRCGAQKVARAVAWLKRRHLTPPTRQRSWGVAADR